MYGNDGEKWFWLFSWIGFRVSDRIRLRGLVLHRMYIYRLALLIPLWDWILERFTRALCSKGSPYNFPSVQDSFTSTFFHSYRFQFLSRVASLTQKLPSNFVPRALERCPKEIQRRFETIASLADARRPCLPGNRHA